MKMVWEPGTMPGFTMTSALTVLSDFTTRASGNRRWICSARLSVLQTLRLGGMPWEKSKGLDTSITTLPARLSAPAASRAGSDPSPDVALTTISAVEAASANDPSAADPPAPGDPPPTDATQATAFSFPA